MKHVVSISLGSSRRDKKVEAKLFGDDFILERIGTDGDMREFSRKFGELDGKVDAFGVGGADIYVYANGNRYAFPEIVGLLAHVKLTPFVDGSGLKNTIERECIVRLQNEGVVDFGQKSVLMVCSVDRFGMAEAIAERCWSIVFGDLMFGLGIPFALHSWKSTQNLARLLLPMVVRLPYKWLYPTGEQQNQNTPKFEKYFEGADIIAGDYHYIKRYMPENLTGKIILTNTTTEEDAIELKKRGVTKLITTTPVFEGRSFGTNLLEAAMVAHLGTSPDQINPDDYLRLMREMDWAPTIQELNPAGESC